MNNNLFTYCLRLGDNSLILGHRLSEYCSYGPFLEEDVAISNVALDHLGLAESLLNYASQVSGEGTADTLTFKRNEIDFTNVKLVELPNTDYALIMAKQFFLDAYNYYLLQSLSGSKDETLQSIAQKSFKEVTYHLRRSISWIKRLGDGTEESHRRIQEALEEVWPFTGELFEKDAVEEALIVEGIAANVDQIKKDWMALVQKVLAEATLEMPIGDFFHTGGRKGYHTEFMGKMLTDMQYLNRAYPDATWH